MMKTVMNTAVDNLSESIATKLMVGGAVGMATPSIGLFHSMLQQLNENAPAFTIIISFAIAGVGGLIKIANHLELRKQTKEMKRHNKAIEREKKADKST